MILVTLFRVLPIWMLCFNSAYSIKPKWRELGVTGRTKWYNCTAHGKTGDLLSWYQIKERGSEPVLLKRMQHTTNSSLMYIVIGWTLELSDNGSKIYCAKQSIISPEGKLSEEMKSDITLPFTVHKSNQPLNIPYITVTPNASAVMFDTNANVTFICEGSKTVDGRELTWYIQGSNTKPILANNQTFNSTENVNHLELRLNQSYHCKQLFCAQDFHLHRLPPEGGTAVIDRYGELTRSNMTLLRVRGKEDCDAEKSNSDKDRVERDRQRIIEDIGTEDGNNVVKDGDAAAVSTGGVPIVAVIPVVLVVLVLALLIIAAIWFRCHWRSVTYSRTNIQTHKNVDVVRSAVAESRDAKRSDLPVFDCNPKDLQGTEVTYAALQFPAPTAGNTQTRVNFDDKASPEVTYAALEFSAPAAGARLA